jgi:hypothetical protein
MAGANMAGAYMTGAKSFEPFVSMGPIGPSNASLIFYLVQDLVRESWWWSGTYAEFEARVRKTHQPDSVDLAGYLTALAMAQTLRSIQPVRPEAAPEVPPFADGQKVRLTDDARKTWPWANQEAGEVVGCRNGWTRIEFEDCYLSFPDGALQLERAAAEKEA